MSEKVKLVIEIPKYYLTHPQDYTCLAECVRRGTPIPDNATNGDVIKAMFPDAEIHFDENDVFFHHMGFWIKCNIRWWNAPYQKGDKE